MKDSGIQTRSMTPILILFHELAHLFGNGIGSFIEDEQEVVDRFENEFRQRVGAGRRGRYKGYGTDFACPPPLGPSVRYGPRGIPIFAPGSFSSPRKF